MVQLLNRTNELNATNNRYTLESIKEDYNNKAIKMFKVNLKDNFGDYGLIADAVVEEIERKFQSGEILAVCCNLLWNESLDVPDIDHVI